ncbi:MAG: hypothetical protein EBT52_08790, partial [Flavobacteriia bacterium]|nr:hypothetical protein [Flavobacteriia bacterium]
RINRYFGALTHSFGVMEKGMDRKQFLDFRMSLIPASGFQSAQYRMIEIHATDFVRLLHKDQREKWPMQKRTSPQCSSTSIGRKVPSWPKRKKRP